MPAAALASPRLRAFVHDLESMEAGALRALQRAFAAASKEVEHDLAKWLARGDMHGRYTAARLLQIRHLIGIGQGKHLGPFATVAGRVRSIMGEAAAPKVARATVIGDLEAIDRHFGTMPLIEIRQAGRFLATNDNLVLQQHATSAARYQGQVQADLRMQFGVGLVKGESIRELAKRIASLGTFQAAVDDGTTPAQAARAMARSLGRRYYYRAERLVRTELIADYNAAAHDMISTAANLDPRIVMVWDASLDNRVCVDCRALHGKRLLAPFGMFPGGHTHPPAHPYCRCSIVAELIDDPGGTAFDDDVE